MGALKAAFKNVTSVITALNAPFVGEL